MSIPKEWEDIFDEFVSYMRQRHQEDQHIALLSKNEELAIGIFTDWMQRNYRTPRRRPHDAQLEFWQ